MCRVNGKKYWCDRLHACRAVARVGMVSDPVLLSYFNSDLNKDTDFFEYEYKTYVLDLDFYSDIYSIQLKAYIVKFHIDK